MDIVFILGIWVKGFIILLFNILYRVGWFFFVWMDNSRIGIIFVLNLKIIGVLILLGSFEFIIFNLLCILLVNILIL